MRFEDAGIDGGCEEAVRGGGKGDENKEGQVLVLIQHLTAPRTTHESIQNATVPHRCAALSS